MNGVFDFYQWLHMERRRQTGFFFRAHLRITTKARGDLKIEILALQVTFKHRGLRLFQQVLYVHRALFTRFLKHSGFIIFSYSVL